MRVLLLGATGFIGRYVADRLLADPAVHLTALGRRDDSDVRFDLASGGPAPSPGSWTPSTPASSSAARAPPAAAPAT